MINKNFNELKNEEKVYLKEVRSNIVNSFDAIVTYNNIDLTSDKEDEFPLAEKDLKKNCVLHPIQQSLGRH